jgi:hypothetical protein
VYVTDVATAIRVEPAAVTGLESRREEVRMHFDKFSFGTLQIDGSTYEQDVVIDRGEIRKRKKKPSRKFRDEFGQTPVSIEETIPWKCHRLVISTGAYGRLPVIKEVKREAERRHIELAIVPTREAIRLIEKESDANAILYLTC